MNSLICTGSLIGRSSLVAAAFIAVLGSGAAIAAEPVPDVAAAGVHVRYTAGELADPAGAEALYRRIQAAAQRACQKPDIRDLHVYEIYEACYLRAVDTAVARIDASALTAVHRSKTQHGAAG